MVIKARNNSREGLLWTLVKSITDFDLGACVETTGDIDPSACYLFEPADLIII